MCILLLGNVLIVLRFVICVMLMSVMGCVMLFFIRLSRFVLLLMKVVLGCCVVCMVLVMLVVCL